MSEIMSFKVRVFFKKEGRLAMLSHLEVARSLERAIRRAQLPFAISQGFSPHMKIAFGSALPVGVGGLKECFDLQLTRYLAPQEVLSALKASSVDGLMVFDCRAVGAREPAPSVAYPVNRYRVELTASLPDDALVPETITVIRKKKEKVLTVGEFLMGDISRAGSILDFTLQAKPTGSLRPDKLVQALIEGHDGVDVVSITRIDQREV